MIITTTTNRAFAQDNSCRFEKQQQVAEGETTKLPLPITLPLDPTRVPPTVPPPSNGFGDRIIYFMHGLGGDEYAWKPVEGATYFGAPDFPARKAETLNGTYTAGDMTMNVCAQNAAFKLHDKSLLLHQDAYEKSKNMIIAHSQGSLVSRTMNMQAESLSDDHEFGGIVFFDGPQDGAIIIKNARSINNGGTGLGAELVSQGCSKLMPAILAANLKTQGAFSKLLVLKAGEAVADLACDKLNFVFQQLINGYAQQIQTNAYLPGAQHLADLRNYEESSSRAFKTHRVNFYSTEPSDFQIWRTLNYIYHPSINEEVFKATADYGPGTLKHSVDSILNIFVKNKGYAQGALNHYGCNTWEYILHIAVCETNQELLNQYNAGIEFFATANDQWRVIIGEKYTEKKCRVTLYQEDYWANNQCQQDFDFWDIPYEQCGEKAEELYDDYQGSNLGCSNGQVFGYSTSPLLKWYEQDSDGIVTTASQMALPDGTLPAVHLDNSSHMQIRNDLNTKYSLLKVFNGDFNLDEDAPIEQKESRDWFKTDKK